jgi:MFS family permease
VIGVTLGMAAAGKAAMGALGDRIGGKNALALGFVLLAGGTLEQLYVHGHVAVLVIWVIAIGIAGAAPVALVPMVQAEALGLKRFGSIGGLLNLISTIGAAIGPVLVGRMADVAHSYAGGCQILCRGLPDRRGRELHMRRATGNGCR